MRQANGEREREEVAPTWERGGRAGWSHRESARFQGSPVVRPKATKTRQSPKN